MGADRPFTVLIEPYKGCNMACRYCYSDVRSEARMPLDTLRVVLERLLEYLDQEGITRANLTWHGGEPLLAGHDFFEAAFAQCDRLGLSPRITHHLQTNGTLLDDAWCDLVRERGIQVSLSLDGPPDVMRATRPGREPGFDSFAVVMDRMALLRRRDIPFAVLVVVTQANVGRAHELYTFFRRMGVTFKVNPVMHSPHQQEATRELGVTAPQYGRFLCQLFDAWMEDEDSPIRVGTIDTYIKNVMAGRAFNCQHRPSCVGHIVGVRPDGSINPCTRFEHSSGRTLLEAGMRELMGERPFTDITHRADLLTDCHACRFVSICHGGCPQHAEAFHGDCMRKDYFCGAYQMIYSHISAYLRDQA